jgi:hypothetical protein
MVTLKIWGRTLNFWYFRVYLSRVQNVNTDREVVMITPTPRGQALLPW